MELINEVDLLKKIKSGNSESFKYLYKKMYPVIANYIKLNGGSEEEAKDVFQDAVVVLYRKLKDDTFELTCKIQTFLYSVSRNIWLNELKNKSLLSPENEIRDQHEETTETDPQENDIRSRIVLLNNSLDKLGEPCASILKMYYIDDLSMNEIAGKMNYTNADNAKNQKYKCLIRLKKIFFRLQTNPAKIN
jgi:RNA polymerase sigma factor (sigma-70 family)